MDLDVAASGGGYGHTECPQGIPVEFALLSILAAFGVAFGVLYMALTLQTMGRRRRSTGEGEGEEQYGGDLAFKFGDLLWAGELICFGIHNLISHFHLFWPFDVRETVIKENLYSFGRYPSPLPIIHSGHRKRCNKAGW